MKIVIEISKNNRLFFLTEYENRYQLTWIKENAKIFDSYDDAKNFISEEYRNIPTNYKLVDYSLAKNH